MYKGIGASAGIGIGKIVKIKEEELNYTKQSIEDTEAEKKRLSDAIEAVSYTHLTLPTILRV